MTDNKTQAETTPDGDTVRHSGGVGGRRLVMANVVVATLLVVGLLVAANYVAWWLDKKYDLEVDLTEGQRYSFSERTTLMLERMDQPIRLTALYVPDDKNDEVARQTRTVKELIRQYESQSIQVTAESIDMFEDVEALRELGRRLSATYADEMKPYEEAIKTVVAAQRTLITTLAAEAKRYRDAATVEGIPPVVKDMMVYTASDLDDEREAYEDLVAQMEKAFPEQLGLQTEEAAAQAGDLGVPKYREAIDRAGRAMQWTSIVLDRTAAEASQIARTGGLNLPPAVMDVLGKAEGRYEIVKSQMRTALKPSSDLKPLTIQRLKDEVVAGSVVVEVAGKVVVVPRDSLWPPKNSQNAKDDKRVYNGEAAITSAVLAMTMTERPTAIFANHGGPPVTESNRCPFGEIARRLTRSGFTIENWDLTKSDNVPDLTGEGTVVVVMPPVQPRRQFMMQTQTPPPSPAVYEPIRKFVEQGGAAVFMLTLHPIGDADLPYTDIVTAQGFKTNQMALVLTSVEGPKGKAQFGAAYGPTVYPSEAGAGQAHRIAQAIQGFRGRFAWPIALQAAEKLPDGTTIFPLVEATSPGKIWGEVNLNSISLNDGPKYNAGADIDGPFMLVAAAERTIPATAKVGRAVVFATPTAIMDRDAQGHPYAGASVRQTDDGKNELVYTYPANAELFTNAMLWLADMDDMIAVSPAAHDERRIAIIDDDRTNLIRWLVWAGWPLAVVITGIVVFVVRRRVR